MTAGAVAGSGRPGASGLVAGVDGGGSRTRLLVADLRGRERTHVEGGPTLVDPRNPAGAAERLEELLRKAAAEGGFSLPLEALWAGLAGAGRPAVAEAVQAELRARGLAVRVRVGTDVEAAHRDAFDGQAGIVLVAGTGSVVFGVGPGGRKVRVGGWGGLLGDEGSGYALGLGGLRAVLRAGDGLVPPTALTPLLLEATGVEEAVELVEWAATAGKEGIAALAPLVVRAAEAGDGVARRIVREGLLHLRVGLLRVVELLAPWAGAPRVALTGGVAGPGGSLHEAVAAVVRAAGCAPLEAEVRGERGAVRLALELLRRSA